MPAFSCSGTSRKDSAVSRHHLWHLGSQTKNSKRFLFLGEMASFFRRTQECGSRVSGRRSLHLRAAAEQKPVSDAGAAARAERAKCEELLNLGGMNLILPLMIIPIKWISKMVHGGLKKNMHPFRREAQAHEVTSWTPRTFKGVTDGGLPNKVVPRPTVGWGKELEPNTILGGELRVQVTVFGVGKDSDKTP